jgi:probable rRNA maturation factor
VEVDDGSGPQRRGPDRPPPDPGDLPLLLGDVVICPSVAVAQAPSHAGTVDDELALLVVHGVLHVLGHDHQHPDEMARMRAREVDLLQELHWYGPVPAGFRQEQPG